MRSECQPDPPDRLPRRRSPTSNTPSKTPVAIMTGTQERIRRALDAGPNYCAALQMDWAEFQRRLHPTPPRPVPTNWTG